MTSLNLVYFSSKLNFVFIYYISYSSFDYKFALMTVRAVVGEFKDEKQGYTFHVTHTFYLQKYIITLIEYMIVQMFAIKQESHIAHDQSTSRDICFEVHIILFTSCIRLWRFGSVKSCRRFFLTELLCVFR